MKIYFRNYFFILEKNRRSGEEFKYQHLFSWTGREKHCETGYICHVDVTSSGLGLHNSGEGLSFHSQYLRIVCSISVSAGN